MRSKLFDKRRVKGRNKGEGKSEFFFDAIKNHFDVVKLS